MAVMRHKITTQYGLSLVELMVAVTIGLIVSGAVATIFIQSKASYTQNDEINYLQDNGRYALNQLASDLEIAGFFGGMAAPDTISFEPDPLIDNYLISGSSFECGPATKIISGVASWTYDAGKPISYSASPDASTVAANFPCVAGYQSGSDFLAVKRVKGEALTGSLASHTVYLYTDHSDGAFHTNKIPLPGTMEAYEYYVHLYYLKNNILKKMYLVWDGSKFAMKETDLAEGIENFHIVFGIDSATDTDTIPDYYTSTPSDTELASAVTARVYVLARGSKEMSGYTNAKTYQLGDLTVDYSSSSDGYYRRVFSTAVVLRNPVMISKFSN
jgi:type IV pilus assembly protein PilW